MCCKSFDSRTHVVTISDVKMRLRCRTKQNVGGVVVVGGGPGGNWDPPGLSFRQGRRRRRQLSELIALSRNAKKLIISSPKYRGYVVGPGGNGPGGNWDLVGRRHDMDDDDDRRKPILLRYAPTDSTDAAPHATTRRHRTTDRRHGASSGAPRCAPAENDHAAAICGCCSADKWSRRTSEPRTVFPHSPECTFHRPPRPTATASEWPELAAWMNETHSS